MSLAKTFYLLKAAEMRLGELYAAMGLSLAVTHPGHYDLFSELAEDEKMHARQIELMQNIFMQGRDAFAENPEAEGIIVTFTENVDTVMKYFNEKHQELTPADMIRLALDLEGDLVERHRTFFMKVSDPQIKRLFESLNLVDEFHIRKLKDFKPA
jgi:rubrerythrin